MGVSEIAALLLRNTAHPAHRFLALDFGFEEVLGHCTGGLHGHRQITDAYLLTAAIRSKLKLLTFDSGVPQLLATEPERQAHVQVLA